MLIPTSLKVLKNSANNSKFSGVSRSSLNSGTPSLVLILTFLPLLLSANGIVLNKVPK
jgi:hypothetical protein